MIQFTVLSSPALAYVLSIPRLRHFIPSRLSQAFVVS